jgi:FixJ family two-component response regulator
VRGAGSAQNLRANLNDIPVIIISAHADVPVTVRGMKLGAVDVLQKPVEPSALREAIRHSLALSKALYQQRQDAQAVRQRFEHLTTREMELLGYIVDGQSNKQIARLLGISIKTVANHRASLMTKSGAANAADLARLFTMHLALSRNTSGSPVIGS